MEESIIKNFYKTKNVFITGGTGFMGKILIEKLLRSTELSTMYLLIREKKGKNALTRIDELFDDVVFDRLKKEQPKFKHRIEAIPGDCSIAGLGLSINDRQKIITNVEIVFHVAATVNFDENLKLAYTVNVNSIKDVIEMAKQMKKLKSLIHVSTAYSNCHIKYIEEKFYDCPYSYDSVAKILEKVSKSEAELLTPRIISPWPNTYTFTKALGESVVKTLATDVPVGVFRPAIVISTYREPLEGWIDNMYGPTGVCAGVISGVMRVMPCDKSTIADLVPVDTCVAGLIASAWDVAEKYKERTRTQENIPIYNYVSSAENPIIWNEFIELNLIHGKNYPVKNTLWHSSVLLQQNMIIYWILKILLHIVPAFIIDCLAVLTGNKPKLLQMYKKIHKFSEILTYFCTRSWTFSNENTKNLWRKLNRTDQELFPLSITTVHWLVYFKGYIKGMRQHLLKDPESTLDDARKRASRFSILNSILKVLGIFALCSLANSMFCKLLGVIF